MEVDDFRIVGALEMVEMFVLPTRGVMALSVVMTDEERAGQTEMVRAGRIEVDRGGKIDGVSERSSSTQLLLFCMTETILSPG